MIKRLALVPARIGSKRIKQKNIKIINKKPLIQITINKLKEVKIFDKIHISTESLVIKKLSEKNGIKFDFLRPKNLSKDNIPISKVVKYTLKKYKKLGKTFDEVWIFYVTNPFLKKSHIKNAYKIYKRNKGKVSVMSVSNYNYPIQWALTVNKKNYLTPINFKNSKINKNKVYCEAGMFVIYQKNFLNKNANIKYKPYIIPIWDTIDIDTIDDFKLAKKLLKGNNK